MSAFAKCDGCGKTASMLEAHGNFIKPSDWFQRSDEEGIQLACSRDCIKEVARKTGKTDAMLPV